MTFLDVYHNCTCCPVKEYCGTMVSTMRLCNSYKGEKKVTTAAPVATTTPVEIKNLGNPFE